MSQSALQTVGARPDRRRRSSLSIIQVLERFSELGSNLRRGGSVGPDEVVLVLPRQLLERLALGLRNEKRREDSSEHEEGKDLEDVVDPVARAVLQQ